MTNTTEDNLKLVQSLVILVKNIIFFDNVYVTQQQVYNTDSATTTSSYPIFNSSEFDFTN